MQALLYTQCIVWVGGACCKRFYLCFSLNLILSLSHSQAFMKRTKLNASQINKQKSATNFSPHENNSKRICYVSRIIKTPEHSPGVFCSYTIEYLVVAQTAAACFRAQDLAQLPLSVTDRCPGVTYLTIDILTKIASP